MKLNFTRLASGKQMFLLGLFFCSIGILKAQEFSSKELPNTKERHLFLIAAGDTLSGIGEKERINFIGNKIESFSFFEKNSTEGETQERINFQNFTPIAVNEKTYFIENGLGKVYEWTNRGFQRVDNSFTFRNHFGGSIFEHDGQIFNYGGYGFWNFQDFFIRFSGSMKEWNMHVHNSKIIPPGRKNHFFHKTSNKFIAFAGESYDGFLNDIFAFDFDQNNFAFVEKLNPEFPYNGASLFHAHQGNVRYYLMPDLKWLKLDFDKLTFQTTESITGLEGQSLSSNVLIHQGRLHFISYKTGKLRLNSISLEKLNTLLSAPKDLMIINKSSLFMYGIIGLMGLLLVRFLFIVLRWKNIKKTTPLLQKRYLTFKKSILIFTEEEKSILELLMQSKGVSSQEISLLDCYAEYSESYRLIATLNDLKSLTNKIENTKSIRKVLSIEKITDPKDRRQKKYKLNGKVVIYRGWVNHFLGLKHSFAS